MVTNTNLKNFAETAFVISIYENSQKISKSTKFVDSVSLPFAKLLMVSLYDRHGTESTGNEFTRSHRLIW